MPPNISPLAESRAWQLQVTYKAVGRDLHEAVDGEAEVDVTAPAVGVECEAVVAERVDEPVVKQDQGLEQQAPVLQQVEKRGLLLESLGPFPARRMQLPV